LCEQCRHEEPASGQWGLLTWIDVWTLSWTAYENVTITTHSSPEAFPSALRQKRKTQTKYHEKGDQGTLVCDNTIACHCVFKSKWTGRWQRNALRVDTWRLILKKCRYAWWSSKNREKMTVISAKECRRGLDDILHGEYAFYYLAGLHLTRWQCVSCKHGWRVNN
jgi:DNA-directed RNA polymerase I subunit RPA12